MSANGYVPTNFDDDLPITTSVPTRGQRPRNQIVPASYEHYQHYPTVIKQERGAIMEQFIVDERKEDKAELKEYRKKEITELDRKTTKYRNEIAKLRGEFKEAMALVETRGKKLDAIEAENRELNLALDNSASDALAKLNQAEQENSEMHRKFDKAKQENSMMHQKFGQAEISIKDLNDRLADITSEAQTLSNELRKYRDVCINTACIGTCGLKYHVVDHTLMQPIISSQPITISLQPTSSSPQIKVQQSAIPPKLKSNQLVDLADGSDPLSFDDTFDDDDASDDEAGKELEMQLRAAQKADANSKK
jgi:hypothetical protein